jgi:hypothetical protein
MFIYIYLLLLLPTFLDAACTEDFLSINNNKEKFEKVMGMFFYRFYYYKNNRIY